MHTPFRGDRTQPRRSRIAIFVWWTVAALAMAGFAAACSSEAQDQLSSALEDSAGGSTDDSSSGDDGSGGDGSTDDSSSGDDSSGGDGSTDDSSGGDGSTDDSSGGDGSSGDGSSATTPPDTEATTESGLTSEDWILIAILGVAAFAIIVGAVTMATRHSEEKAAAASATSRQLSEIVGTSRWIHDSGSLEALRHSDGDQLRAATNDVRQRMVDLEARIATTSTGDSATDTSLRGLGQSVAALRGAMDTLVTVRLAPDAGEQAELIDNATQTYNVRRQQLDAAIGPVAVAVR